jgi:hypothetical protein
MSIPLKFPLIEPIEGEWGKYSLREKKVKKQSTIRITQIAWEKSCKLQLVDGTDKCRHNSIGTNIKDISQKKMFFCDMDIELYGQLPNNM